jgi:hypothetical protein
MGNNTTDSKLDETVKNTLNNYEGQFDADWSRMESMLNAAPKSTTFSWSAPLAIIIGVVVIGGGYLMFRNTDSSKPSTETTVETSQPAVTVTPEKVTVSPAVTKTETPVVSAPIVKEIPVIAPPVKTTLPINTNSTTFTSIDKNTVKEKSAKEKDVKKEKQTVSVMGNEPIFGDMIDSSKGVIHETKEKEKTKKDAVKTSSTPIGWGLLNQNIDSLRKQKEQMKKDSIK